MTQTVSSLNGRLLVASAATATMAVSLSMLFVLAVLGPALVEALALDHAAIGATVAASYAFAAVIWRPAADVVSRLGGPRSMAAAAGIVGLALVIVATADGVEGLVVGAVIAGAAQAMANPATNLAVAEAFEPGLGRASAIGTKQAGVPLGALVLGATLPSAAAMWGWRWAVGLVAVVALVVAALIVVAAPAATRRSPSELGGLDVGRDPGLLELFAFQALLGAGLSVVNVYLPLFATDVFGATARMAGMLTVALGVTGIGARIAMTWFAGARGSARALTRLSLLAAIGVLALAAAPTVGLWSVWTGAVVVGSTAVGANAIAMLLLVDRYRPPATARATGMVSAGFFAGFAIAPPSFGALTDVTDSYVPGWVLAAATFAAASVLGRRHHRQVPPTGHPQGASDKR